MVTGPLGEVVANPVAPPEELLLCDVVIFHFPFLSELDGCEIVVQY